MSPYKKFKDKYNAVWFKIWTTKDLKILQEISETKLFIPWTPSQEKLSSLLA